MNYKSKNSGGINNPQTTNHNPNLTQQINPYINRGTILSQGIPSAELQQSFLPQNSVAQYMN